MKKILITGADSYIGTSLEKWLSQWPGNYSITTIDMRSAEWKKKVSFGYDVLLHVAGIVHIKETKENSGLYYKINRDLAYEVALKAKQEGIKQFIFLSTMNVYGMVTGIITKNSIPSPISNYGKSKLQAEEMIRGLEDKNFKIAIIRPPMVYGKGCKGNYARLRKIVLELPVFPDICNKRSMIFIDNLCNFIKLVIDNFSRGMFFPQNTEYVCTSELAKLIAVANGKKLYLTKSFNFVLKLLKLSTTNKLFGDLLYEKEISDYEGYAAIPLKITVKMTES